MKRILSTLSDKWPEYLLEVVVIIVGILGAFALNNWNNTRLDLIREQQILLQLKNEYQQNLDQLEDKIEMRNLLIQHSRKTLDLMDNREQASLDSLVEHAKYLGLMPTFDPLSSDIIVSGNIRLIQNQSLRERLLAWSSEVVQLQEEEQKWVQMDVEQLLPVLHRLELTRHLVAAGPDKSAIDLILIEKSDEIKPAAVSSGGRKVNLVEVLRDRQFEGLVITGISFNSTANDQSSILRTRIQEILRLIDAELMP